MEAVKKEERILARVTRDVHSTLQQAAVIVGATVNQFLVQAALKEARGIIERERIIQLHSARRGNIFQDAGTRAETQGKTAQSSSGIPAIGAQYETLSRSGLGCRQLV